MTLVLIASQSWGVLQDRRGNVQALMAVTITDVDGDPVVVYSADDTGSTPVATVSDARGEIPGYIQTGTYLLDDGERVRKVEAVSGGAGGSVVTATGPLTTATADPLVPAGGTLYELDADGNVVAEWVKTSA